MTTNIIVPELGESVVEATVSEWLKKEGDAVRSGEAIVVLETDKVNFEVTVQTEGVLERILRFAGEDVKVGEVLGTITEGVQAPKQEDEKVEQVAPVASGATVAQASKRQVTKEKVEPAADVQVTPVARRVAEKHGIDPAGVQASKSGGRVTKEDVEQHLAKHSNGRKASPHSSEREERIPMSRRRRTIAQRLVEAQHTAAMLTSFNEIDMTGIMALRERHKETFKERHAVNLGITSFFVKAAIGALKEFPQVNAELEGEEIILKYHYDIGVAIGAEEGLVVPILHDADRMSLAEIERAIKDYAQRSEAGTLSLEDLRGGTFTITNGGVFGSLLSTPILNPPQVGILGLHKIEERPVAIGGEVKIHSMMYVALSYDHRIIDGREAVQFLVRLKELVEEPERLFLEG